MLETRVGDIIPIPGSGVPGKVVGFRDKVRGEISDGMPGRKMYPVVVEQGGSYRMATLTPRVVVSHATP